MHIIVKKKLYFLKDPKDPFHLVTYMSYFKSFDTSITIN